MYYQVLNPPGQSAPGVLGPDEPFWGWMSLFKQWLELQVYTQLVA